MYLLDTNICIAILNQNRPVLRAFGRRSSQCCLPTIVMAELYKGAYCSQRVQQNIDNLEQFFELMPAVVEFDRDAAMEFGKIQAELRQPGKPTGELDAAIAAIARSRGDILVTNNIRDFMHIPTLHLENWLT